MVEDPAAHVALALVPGIGPARFTALLTTFGSPDGALAAPFEALCRLPGFSRAAATAVRSARPEQGRKVLDRLETIGGRCLLPGDAEFPQALHPIPDSPPLLFVLGNLALLGRPAVAIVGSRNHSAYGGEVCGLLAGAAGRAGLAVVSGMARGLDAMAHTAALDAGGATIGVLGNGLGVIYPSANRALYERVAQEGLLLTEFPPGERPHAGSFPRRNRLISGLARVTVVVEAAAGSGTLITVAAALEQGREVMAVPGAITSPTSVGTNGLIRDGATPLLEIDDLLGYYPEAVRGGASPADAPPPIARESPALPSPATIAGAPEERRVLEALASPRHIDDLAKVAELPVGEALGHLCSLEIAGLVEQRPGRIFCLVSTRR